MPQYLTRVVAVLVLLVCSGPASAHEFWLDPAAFTPRVGDRVPVVLRNGMHFLGDSYPYQRKWATRFSAFDSRGERQIKAVEGDDPGADVPITAPGLTIIAFERAADTVDYLSLGHFLQVLDDEGLDPFAARYRAAADAPQKFQEIYTRHAKTLLSAGAPGGTDKAVGLALEIVVETNPYTLQPGAPLIARVLQAGRPVSDVQVKIFNRPPKIESALEPKRLRTDAEGRVRIDGLVSGEVLLNAVVMKPVPDQTSNVLPTRWESRWATVTFKLR